MLEDGTTIDVADLKPAESFQVAKSKSLAKVDLKLEVRRTTILEAFVKGTGEFYSMRGYRWVDKKGADLDLPFEREGQGGGQTVSAKCRMPEGLPKGAQLQFGVLVGAVQETISFEYENIAGPE